MDKINNKKIVLIDDSKNSYLNELLLSNDYQTILTSKLNNAYDYVTKSERNIGLIIVNLINTESIDELLTFVKSINSNYSLPIVILSDKYSLNEELRIYSNGALEIFKPDNEDILLCKIRNIFELVNNQSYYDSLTGLLNKDGFKVIAERELKKNPEKEYSLLYTNIENFKMINSRNGIEGGDKVLCFIGACFKRLFHDSIVCRVYADKFVILVKRELLPSKEKIFNIYNEYMVDCPIEGIHSKCGIYHITNHNDSVEIISDRAKLALDSLKNRYDEYICYYEDNMQKSVIREHQLANDMVEALISKQFVVYLQPKHDTQTGEICGAEALVRWIHPELGFISPGEFIPLFEKNGFISKLDLFVWEESCRVLREYLDEGLNPMPISVNASRNDFTNNNLPLIFDELIEKYDLDPSLLHIEVTESAYSDNPKQMIDMLSQLRDMGFKIEMDDFGSGYSSLNMLSDLPIDILKLDMKFMDRGDAKLQASKRNILSFVVSLSKWLSLPTIAEGVETLEEVETLKSYGVTMIQGYFYSKPLQLEVFKKYFLDHKKNYIAKDIDCLIDNTATSNANEDKPLVLVVEDIYSNQVMLKRILETKYTVICRNNGQEGLDYLQENSKNVSCIMLDLLMPVMDGFTFFEKICKNKALKDIPVIITTEASNSGETKSIQIGAFSYVSKPYDKLLVEYNVKKAIEERVNIQIRKKYNLENCTFSDYLRWGD